MVALQKTRPVIFLAFANSSANPLPHLAEECRRLTDIVEDAAHAGICDLLVRPYATVDQILDAFDQEEQRGRIAVFHYAGRADELAAAFQLSKSTVGNRSKQIKDILDIGVFDPDWTLPSRLDDNPMAWMITVNGLIINARYAPRAIQEEAFRKGLIPYVPTRTE